MHNWTAFEMLLSSLQDCWMTNVLCLCMHSIDVFAQCRQVCRDGLWALMSKVERETQTVMQIW